MGVLFSSHLAPLISGDLPFLGKEGAMGSPPKTRGGSPRCDSLQRRKTTGRTQQGFLSNLPSWHMDAAWAIAELCSGRGWGEVLLVCPCPSPLLEQRILLF